jgi:beta-glucosidase
MPGSFVQVRRRPYRLVDRFAAIAVVAVIAAACGPACPTASGMSSAGLVRPWMDASLSVEQRIAALLPRMTLDEKIGQMTQITDVADNDWTWTHPRDPAVVKTALLGSLLSGGGLDAQTRFTRVSDFQLAALVTDLGIPILYAYDAVHGDGQLAGATIFPHNVGMGATRDAALVKRECQVTAAEMYATGVRWNFGPVVAVPQDVRWGRTYEGYGENTDLVSKLGTACLTGLQGSNYSYEMIETCRQAGNPGCGNTLTHPDTVVATPKHFLGDGGTAYGSSTQYIGQQYLLDQGVDMLTDAQIEQLFLPPYENAVANGARIIMVSFSSTQSGGKMSGNKHWLTGVLKEGLGFTGFLVSDWGAIDQIDPNDYSASVKAAINAGIDMAMVPYDWSKFESTLKALVQSGDVPQSRIDDAVTRILRVKFEMGLFENPMPPSGRWNAVGSDANRAVARQAVAESAVLLKTSSGVLPIAKPGKTGPGQSVFLAGPGADSAVISSGGWTHSPAGTTLKAELQAQLGANLTYSAGADFTTGTHASVGIVVVSEDIYAEGGGDSATLQDKLVDGDKELVADMKPFANKVVLVIYSGRPIVLDGIADSADVVIAAWLPGTEAGPGLADVLLGDKPFTGVTPYTWPRTAADAPRIGKTACQGAVYPYGYGLKADGTLIGPAAC